MSDQPSFWAKPWDVFRKYVLAPLPILVIVVVAVLLVALGAKNVQIGGLIGKILGKKDSKKAVDVANTIPKDRIGADGTLIPIGTPDAKGLTQAKVVPIQNPGLFDDPSKVKIMDKGKVVDVPLPTGVKAKDVEHVVVISPEVTAVTVKTGSSVKAGDVDQLLKKYRK